MFSSLQLDLADAPGVLIRDLLNQPQPFDLHHNGVGMEEKVEVFKAVIGQDGKMIQAGDYIKLSFEHHEVRVSAHHLVCYIHELTCTLIHQRGSVHLWLSIGCVHETVGLLGYQCVCVCPSMGLMCW